MLGLKKTLAAANLRMPSGSVLDGDASAAQMLAVETGEFLRSADDVGYVVVGVSQGRPVYLREVARVEAGAQLAAALRLVHAGCGAGGAQDARAGRAGRAGVSRR